jgi:hypothetical protein
MGATYGTKLNWRIVMNKSFYAVFLSVIFTLHNADAKPIEEGQVKQIAKNWALEKWKKKIDRIRTKQKVKAQQYGTDENLYYVLSFPQGGWMIVSADDVAYPVIAFSETGTYSEQGHPIQFEEWMENVKKEISSAIKEKQTHLPKAESAWKHFNVNPESFAPNSSSSFAEASSAKVGVDHLLSTKWGQDKYYNKYCPADSASPKGYGGHVPVGCVAVAMGQIMKYHNYPATGSGSHSYYHQAYGWQSANFGETTYNWDSMPKSLSKYDSDVARILYHVGVSVNMEYTPKWSSANMNDATYAFKKYFNYTDTIRYVEKNDYSINNWTALLRTELNNKRPVLYVGSNSKSGHAFVCDGYSGADYFHFNWGWNGALDGYFYLNDLTPGKHSYPYGQAAVVGIKPPDGASGKLPDFITNKVILAKENGKGERYTWKVNEIPYVHAWIDNIGKIDWYGSADSIKVAFYLSKAGSTDSVLAGLENIKKKNIQVKDKPKKEKIAFNIQEWAAKGQIYAGQNYNFVVCADRPKDQDNGDGDVKEIHKSNNCSTPAVFYVDYGPARNVDVTASNLALTGGRTSLQAGERYGLQADISNIGTEYPWNGCRTSYEISGPSTGGAWQQVANEGSTVAQLGPNSTKVEVIDDSRGLTAPSAAGEYKIRACADYERAIPETDESNNCSSEITVTVTTPPPPSFTPRIVITNPTHDDDWRSDETDHDVRWDYFDFPEKGHVKVEYSLDGGATWLLIDDETTNDGKKHWEDMCDFYTIDTHHAYIRVTSLEYPDATDISDEFSIDHARGCK